MIALIFALTLSWTDNSGVEDGYYVLRKLQTDRTFSYVTTLPANSTRYVDANLRKNRTYCYRTVAFKGEIREYSNADCQKNIR
jgi:hypothetical protein